MTSASLSAMERLPYPADERQARDSLYQFKINNCIVQQRAVFQFQSFIKTGSTVCWSVLQLSGRPFSIRCLLTLYRARFLSLPHALLSPSLSISPFLSPRMLECVVGLWWKCGSSPIQVYVTVGRDILCLILWHVMMPPIAHGQTWLFQPLTVSTVPNTGRNQSDSGYRGLDEEDWMPGGSE